MRNTPEAPDLVTSAVTVVVRAILVEGSWPWRVVQVQGHGQISSSQDLPHSSSALSVQGWPSGSGEGSCLLKNKPKPLRWLSVSPTSPSLEFCVLGCSRVSGLLTSELELFFVP